VQQRDMDCLRGVGWYDGSRDLICLAVACFLAPLPQPRRGLQSNNHSCPSTVDSTADQHRRGSFVDYS